MIKRVCIGLLCAALLLGCLGGCAPTEPSQTAKLSVIATVFPPYDFVRAVAGDRVQLTLLLPPGADSHSFDPSLSDIVSIEQCDLFLYTGGESDLWAKEVLDTCGKQGVSVLAMTDTVPLLPEETVEGMEHEHLHEHTDDCNEHEYAEAYDEHVWTTPDNAIVIVNAITDMLCQLDTPNAAFYRQNAAQYTAQLQGVAQELRAIAQNAKRHTLVFAERFPFRYLTHALGLTYYAAFSGCASATDVKLKTLTFLTQTVKEQDVPVVFCTEFSDGVVADVICRETGAVKRTLHSCHMVTEAEFNSGVTYLDLMKQNCVNLREALCA